MLYIERQPHCRSVVLLVTLSLILYVGSMLLADVRWDMEALQAMMSRDQQVTGDYVKMHVYGISLREFPLYSWLVALSSGFGKLNIVSLRLPSLLSLGGLALCCGLAARRLQSTYAGFIAAAVVLLSGASFRFGSHGVPLMLQALLSFAAWWSWYAFGIEQKRWQLAWGISHLLVFIGILNVGLEAVFWFYLPLLCMPRKLNSRGRMAMPVHVLSAVIFLVLAIVWFVIITPDQPLLPGSRGANPGHNLILKTTLRDTSGYLGHLVTYPWESVAWLLPWGILIWVPFCIAHRRFENVQTAGDYLRTIVYVMFAVFWLWPKSTPFHLLPLLGPLAILIGIHFEIILRRHQHILNSGLRVLAWIVFAGNVLSALFWGIVGCEFIVIELVPRAHAVTFAVLQLILARILWGVILRKSSQCTFRSCILWCIFGARMLTLFTMEYYRCWERSDEKLAGQAIARCPQSAVGMLGQPTGLPEAIDRIYYRPLGETSSLHLTSFFYLDKPVVFVDRKLDLAQALPAEADHVLLLSQRAPLQGAFTWTALGQPVDMNLKRKAVFVFKENGLAQWPWLSVQLQATSRDDASHRHRLQLFEGRRN